MKLTNKQQIEVLEEVLRLFENYIVCVPTGICILVLIELSRQNYCDLYSTACDKVNLFIPLLTIENAVKFGANKDSGAFWWPLSNVEDRIKFIKWMIEQLKNE